MRVIMLFITAWLCAMGEFTDKLDRYIIACHTTDFICFKRQYRALRDYVLVGNCKLAFTRYQPYVVQYGDSGTCARVSGFEESELVGISTNNENKEFSVTLEMPFRIQQLQNNSIACEKPKHDFGDIEKHVGPLKNFTGNATVEVTYPYELRKKKGEIHLHLQHEEVDVTLDIPDMSDYDRNSEAETNRYKWSEWAYTVATHIDAAETFVVPYTSRLRGVYDRLPLRRLLLLYPEEDYANLNFEYNNGALVDEQDEIS